MVKSTADMLYEQLMGSGTVGDKTYSGMLGGGGGDGGGGLSPLGNNILIDDLDTEYFAKINIVDDATSASTWIDRLQFLFNGVLTSWFNEYGEFRVMSAKPSTVALRIFGKNQTADTDHSTTDPVFEVVASRQVRDPRFHVFADGQAVSVKGFRTEIPSGPTLSTGYQLLASAAAVPANTPANTLIFRY